MIVIIRTYELTCQAFSVQIICILNEAPLENGNCSEMIIPPCESPSFKVLITTSDLEKLVLKCNAMLFAFSIAIVNLKR